MEGVVGGRRGATAGGGASAGGYMKPTLGGRPKRSVKRLWRRGLRAGRKRRAEKNGGKPRNGEPPACRVRGTSARQEKRRQAAGAGAPGGNASACRCIAYNTSLRSQRRQQCGNRINIEDSFGSSVHDYRARRLARKSIRPPARVVSVAANSLRGEAEGSESCLVPKIRVAAKLRFNRIEAKTSGGRSGMSVIRTSLRFIGKSTLLPILWLLAVTNGYAQLEYPLNPHHARRPGLGLREAVTRPDSVTDGG